MFGAVCLLLSCVLVLSKVSAQDAVKSRADFADIEARYNGGSWELENLVGAYFLFDRGGNERVTVDYALYNLRVGWMLHDPAFSGFLRGNFELLGELFLGPIFQGPGEVAFGGTLFIRYNFVPRGARVVPYFQVGVGGVCTDIEQGEAASNAVGQDVNFNLQAIFGVRFNLNARWSIQAEAAYRHISNAGMSEPNYGIDQMGGALGVGYAF